jgi:hypothetical protein
MLAKNSETSVFSRRLSVFSFNDAHFKSKQGMSLNSYEYFTYREEPEDPDQDITYLARVISFLTTPVCRNGLGGFLFPSEILGMGLFELMELDPRSFEQIETSLSTTKEILESLPATGKPPEDFTP